uniref:Uncharacterized protein n=1 Tax=Sinocyclocheilus rhinocerous TaxID=307959 RepID=A0A673FUA1_9TELE
MQFQHVRTEDGRAERVVYTYQLSRGHSEERNYGGAAEMTNLPSDITQEAKTVAAKISQKLSKHYSDPATVRQRAVYRVATRLLQTATESVENEE